MKKLDIAMPITLGFDSYFKNPISNLNPNCISVKINNNLSMSDHATSFLIIKK